MLSSTFNTKKADFIKEFLNVEHINTSNDLIIYKSCFSPGLFKMSKLVLLGLAKIISYAEDVLSEFLSKYDKVLCRNNLNDNLENQKDFK